MFFSKHITVIAIFLCTTYAQPKFNHTKPIVSSNIDGQRRSILKPIDMDNYKCFQNIVEEGSTSAIRSSASESAEEPHGEEKSDERYNEIKGLLGQLLQKIKEVEKEKRMEPRDSMPHTMHRINVTTAPELFSRPNLVAVSSAVIKHTMTKKEDVPSGLIPAADKQRWGHWTDWSSCSVSCGKGREIRWRHCMQNCQEAETEMEEKICQLPACSPGNLFGIKF